MDMNFFSHRDHGFQLAIRYFGSINELARRAQIKRGKILYMRNHAEKIHLEDALKIDIATGGIVKWYYFLEAVDEKIKQRIEKGAS